MPSESLIPLIKKQADSFGGVSQIDYTMPYAQPVHRPVLELPKHLPLGDSPRAREWVVGSGGLQGLLIAYVDLFVYTRAVDVPIFVENPAAIYLGEPSEEDKGAIYLLFAEMQKSAIDVDFATRHAESSNKSEEEGLVKLIGGLNEILVKRDFRLIDQLLNSIDIANTKPSFLLAYLRTTYAVRSKLSAWRLLLERCTAEFKKRGLDASKLLQGL